MGEEKETDREGVSAGRLDRRAMKRGQVAERRRAAFMVHSRALQAARTSTPFMRTASNRHVTQCTRARTHTHIHTHTHTHVSTHAPERKALVGPTAACTRRLSRYARGTMGLEAGQF